MAHNVIVTIAAVSQTFPAGTVTAGIKVTLEGVAPVTLTAAPYEATFADIVAGAYTITAQAIDAEGNALGEAVTTTVTVAPDAVNVDVPSSISVVVQ